MNQSTRRFQRRYLAMTVVCLLLVSLPLIARWRSGAPPTADQPAIELPKVIRIAAVAYSPDGRYLAFGGQSPSGTLQVYSWPDRQPQWAAKPRPNVSNITFSPDGLFLLSQEHKAAAAHDARQNGTRNIREQSIVLRRTGDGEVIFSVPAPADCGVISSFRFSPDGKHLVSTGEKLNVWDWERGVIIKSLPQDVSADSDIAFAADGTLAAPVPAKARQPDNEEMRFWDLDTFKIKRRIWLPAGNATRFAFSPDGKLLALIEDKSQPRPHSELQVLNAATGSLLWTETFDDRVSQFAMSRDGKFLVASYRVVDPFMHDTQGAPPYPQYFGFWEANSGKKIAAFPVLKRDGHLVSGFAPQVPGEIRALALTPDGKNLAYNCDDSTAGTHIYFLATPASAPAAKA